MFRISTRGVRCDLYKVKLFYRDFQLVSDILLRRKELVTTQTEDIAMAAEAIMGVSINPVNGSNTPAAMGIPITL